MFKSAPGSIKLFNELNNEHEYATYRRAARTEWWDEAVIQGHVDSLFIWDEECKLDAEAQPHHLLIAEPVSPF